MKQYNCFIILSRLRLISRNFICLKVMCLFLSSLPEESMDPLYSATVTCERLAWEYLIEKESRQVL